MCAPFRGSLSYPPLLKTIFLYGAESEREASNVTFCTTWNLRQQTTWDLSNLRQQQQPEQPETATATHRIHIRGTHMSMGKFQSGFLNKKNIIFPWCISFPQFKNIGVEIFYPGTWDFWKCAIFKKSGLPKIHLKMSHFKDKLHGRNKLLFAPNKNPRTLFNRNEIWDYQQETSQELRMLSSVTINC